MNNLDVRQEISAAGLKLWEVADALGICDSAFSRKLRHELSDDEKQQIRMIIARLSKEELTDGKQ